MVINDKLKGPFYRAPTQKLASRNNVLTTLNELVDYYNNLTKTLESMFDVITQNRDTMKDGLMQMYEKTVRFKKILDSFKYDIDSHILERMNSSIDNFQNVITAFVEPYEANLFNHNTTTDNLASNVSGDDSHTIEEWDRSVNIVPTSLGIRWFGGKFTDKSFIDIVNKHLEIVKVNAVDGHIGEDVIHSNLILEFFIYTPRGITWLVLGENGSLGYNLYIKYQTGGDSIMFDINSENMRIAKNYDLNKFDFEMAVTALVGNDVVRDGNVYIKVKTNIPANHQSGRESYMIYSKNDGSSSATGINSQATQEKNVIDMSHGLMYHDNKDVAFVMGTNDSLADVVGKKFPKTVTPNIMNPISTRVVSNKVDLNKTVIGSRIFVTNGLFSQYSLDSNHNVLFGNTNGDYVSPFYANDIKLVTGKSFTDVEPIFNKSLSEDPKYFEGELSLDMYDETYLNNPSLICKNEVMFAVDNLEMKEKVISNVFGIDKSVLSSNVTMKITNDERFEMASNNSLYQDAIQLKESTDAAFKIFRIYAVDKYIIFGTSDGVYYIDTSISRSGDVIRKINNNGAFGKCYDIIANTPNSVFLSTDKGIHVLNMDTMVISVSGIVNGEWSTMFKLNNGMFGAISRAFNTTVENGRILYKDSVGIMYSSTFNTIRNVFPNNEEYYTISDSAAVAELINEELSVDYMNKRLFQNEFTVIPDPARNRYFIFRYGHKMCVTQNTYMTETTTFDFTNIKLVETLKNYQITSAVMRDNKIYLSTLFGQNYVYDLPSDTVAQIEWNKDVNVNNRLAHRRIYYLKTLNHLKNDDATIDATRTNCYVTIANNEIFFIPLDPTNEVLGITYTNGYYYVLCNNNYIYKLDENWNVVNVIGSKDAKEIIAVENMLFIDSNSFGSFKGYQNDGTQEFDNVHITNDNVIYFGIDENTPFNPEDINLNINMDNYKGLKTYYPRESDVGLNSYHYAMFIDPDAAEKIEAINDNDTVVHVGYMALIDPDIRDDNQYFVHTSIVDLVKKYVLELTGGTITEYPSLDDYVYTPLTQEQLEVGPVSGTTYYTQDIEITDKYELVSSIDVTAPVPNMDYYKLTNDGYVKCTDNDYVTKDVYSKVNVEEVVSPEDGVEYFNKTPSGEYVPMDESTLILEGTRYELVNQVENPYDENTTYYKKTGDDVYTQCTPADFDIGREGETVFFENYEYYLMIPGTIRYFNVNVEYFVKTGETYKEWKSGEDYYTRVVIQENHDRYIDVGTPESFDPDKTYYTRTSKSPITTEFDPTDESEHLLELNTRRVPEIREMYGKNPEDIIDDLNTNDAYWVRFGYGAGGSENSDSAADGDDIMFFDEYEYTEVDKTQTPTPEQNVEYYVHNDNAQGIGLGDDYHYVGTGGSDTLTVWDTDTTYYTRTLVEANHIYADRTATIYNFIRSYGGNITVTKRSFIPVDIFNKVNENEKLSPVDLSIYNNDDNYRILVTKNETDYVPLVGEPTQGQTYYKKIPAGESEPQYIKVNRDVEGTILPSRVYAEWPYGFYGSGILDLPVADPSEDYYFKEYTTEPYKKISFDDLLQMTQNMEVIPESYVNNSKFFYWKDNEFDRISPMMMMIQMDRADIYDPIPTYNENSQVPEKYYDLMAYKLVDGNYIKLTREEIENWVEGTEYYTGCIYYTVDFETVEYFIKEDTVTVSYRKRTPHLLVEYDEFGTGDVYQLKSIDTYVPIPENELQQFINGGGTLYSQRTSHSEYFTPSEYEADYDLYKARTQKLFMHDIPESQQYDANPKYYFVNNDDYAKYSFREIERITFENYNDIPSNLAKVKREAIINYRKLSAEEVAAGAVYGKTYCVRTYSGHPSNNVRYIENGNDVRYAEVDTSVVTVPDPDTTYYYYSSDKENSGYIEIPAGSISAWEPDIQYYFVDKSNKNFDLNTLHTDDIYEVMAEGISIRVVTDVVPKNDVFVLVSASERNQGMQLGKMYFHKIEEDGDVRYEFATETSFDQSVDEYYTLISGFDFAAVDLRDDLEIYHYEIGPGENPKYKFTPITSINEVTSDPYADKGVVYVTCDNFVNGTFWNKHLNAYNDPTLVPKYSDEAVLLSDEDRAKGPQPGYEYFKEVIVETPNGGYELVGTNETIHRLPDDRAVWTYHKVDKTEHPYTFGKDEYHTYNFFKIVDGEYVPCEYDDFEMRSVPLNDGSGMSNMESFFKDDIEYYYRTLDYNYLMLADDGQTYVPIDIENVEADPDYLISQMYYEVDTNVVTVPDPETTYYERTGNYSFTEIPAGTMTEWPPVVNDNYRYFYTKKIYNIYDKLLPITTSSTELVRVDPSELENGFDEDVVYYTKEITSVGNHTFYLQRPGNPGELSYTLDVKVERFLKTDLKNFNIEDFNVYTNPIYDGAYGMISSDLESKFNNNCLNKPRVKTLDVVHNNLERYGGDTNVRGSLSDTIEWFRTGYLDPNGYEIYTNATNTKIRLNGAVTDGNYMTTWYETGFYTPTSAKIYTNYNNTKFRYNNIDYKGSYKDDTVNGTGWFDTMYTVASITPDAGKRILTNYNNSKMMIEGNGVTISEDYKTHWYATNYTPAGIRLYTNYQNNTFNWNGGTFTDDYKTHWFHFKTVTTYNYHRHAWKSGWESYSYNMPLYTNYNNTRTMNGAISGSRQNVYSVIVDRPYTEVRYLYAQWSNDTNHDINPATGDYQQPGGAPTDPSGYRPNVTLYDYHTSAWYRFRLITTNDSYTGYYNQWAEWTGPGLQN